MSNKNTSNQNSMSMNSLQSQFQASNNQGSHDRSSLSPSNLANIHSRQISKSPDKSQRQQSTQQSSAGDFINITSTKYADRGGSQRDELEPDKLEVTVIPVDEEPYSKIITIPPSLLGSAASSSTSGAQDSLNQRKYGALGTSGSSQIHPASSVNNSSSNNTASQQQYPSLKDIFQSKESLWKPIYGAFVQVNKQPLFSIFRKKITMKPDCMIPHPQGEEIGLHILFLKCDGNRFPRNAFANQLEVYCSTYFYGPLVIVYGELSPPYKLHSFQTGFLTERIQPLNEEEQKIYPLPFSAKKCSTVRNLMAERKFTMDLDQHEKAMTLEEFMIYSYKTSFCPYINKKHEWSECNYAHRQQDFRRPPHLYIYYLERCTYVQEDGSWEQCPDYLDCQFSHTLVEQLFSPLNYKLRPCPDRVPDQKFQCKKRLDLCCHNHSQDEKDLAIKALRNPPKILPEHESMQDYIDIIDQEGLLNNKQEDIFEESVSTQQNSSGTKTPQGQNVTAGTNAVAASATSTTNASNNSGSALQPNGGASAGQTTSATNQVQKKAALAKLPEENQDQWRLLEQEMNKQSLQKKDKDGGISSALKQPGNFRDSPDANAFSNMMRFPGDQMEGMIQNQNAAAGLGGGTYQQSNMGHVMGNMNFLDKDAKGPMANQSAGKQMNSLASIIDMPGATEGFHDPQFGSATGPLILGELDGFEDDMLGKMKKGKSLRFPGTNIGQQNHLAAQYAGSQDSMGILGGFGGQKQAEKREDDYVQQLIKANSTHNAPFLGKNGQQKGNALGNNLTTNEQIKVLKAEMRKGKKRVKRSVKVQEFTATTPVSAKGHGMPGQIPKDELSEMPFDSLPSDNISQNHPSSFSQSTSFHTAFNTQIHANAVVPIQQRPESASRPENSGHTGDSRQAAASRLIQQASGNKIRKENEERLGVSIDSKKSKKKVNQEKLSSNKSGPNTNIEEDNFSHWSHSKQKNQWQYERSSKDEANEDDIQVFSSGINESNFQIEREVDTLFVPTLGPSVSAQKKVQQSFELDDNQMRSAASSSSKTKQITGRKSLRSVGPQKVNNPVGGGGTTNVAIVSKISKVGDDCAISQQSQSITPSQELQQQQHKRTLREGQRRQEDLMKVQTVLEEQIISQINNMQIENTLANPFAIAVDANDSKQIQSGSEINQSANKNNQSVFSDKQIGKLSKKGAAGARLGQVDDRRGPGISVESSHSPSKIQYKYARKSVGASTQSTGGGAANTGSKQTMAGLYATAAGAVNAQDSSWDQGDRPSTGAVPNYTSNRESIIFKLSERKYKDNSRFCDLLSSSSNDSSKDEDRRLEDGTSIVSNNFNDVMMMAAEDERRARNNNYDSSLWDQDLVHGVNQRRKHDSVVDKQQFINSSPDPFPQQPPHSIFNLNYLLSDEQVQSPAPVQVQKAQTPVQQNLSSIYSTGVGGAGKQARQGGGGPATQASSIVNLSFSGGIQKRQMYFQQQLDQERGVQQTGADGAEHERRSRAPEVALQQTQTHHLSGGSSQQKLMEIYKQEDSTFFDGMMQTAQSTQQLAQQSDRLQQQLGQPISAAAADNGQLVVEAALGDGDANDLQQSQHINIGSIINLTDTE